MVPAVATTANTSGSSAAATSSPHSRPSRSGDGHETGVHHARRRAHGGVDLLAAGDPAGREAAVARALASRVQRGQVAVGPALHEAAPGAVRQAREIGHPAQRLVLGVHDAAALDPRAGVDAGRAEQHFHERGGDARGARDEGEVARMVDRGRGRQQLVAQQRQGALAAQPVGGDRLPGPRGELGRRDRAPEVRRVGGQALERGAEDRCGELAQLRGQAEHRARVGGALDHRAAIRSAFSAWSLRCSRFRRASGSGAAAPRSASAST